MDARLLLALVQIAQWPEGRVPVRVGHVGQRASRRRMAHLG
ncbi:glycosyl transferase, partial [Paracidovorax avenae]